MRETAQGQRPFLPRFKQQRVRSRMCCSSIDYRSKANKQCWHKWSVSSCISATFLLMCCFPNVYFGHPVFVLHHLTAQQLKARPFPYLVECPITSRSQTEHE
jgi:hypothetical protein